MSVVVKKRRGGRESEKVVVVDRRREWGGGKGRDLWTWMRNRKGRDDEKIGKDCNSCGGNGRGRKGKGGWECLEEQEKTE